MVMLARGLATGFAILGAANVASAEEAKGAVSVKGNVAFVSDYRARGLTVTDNAPAVQGGMTIETASGWSAGFWASSIEPVGGGGAELDLVAAKTFTIKNLEFSLGGTAYVYPSGRDQDYGEVNTSVSSSFGPVDATAGVAYAWDQKNIGDEDNVYVFVNGATPVGTLAGRQLALTGAAGYEDGSLAVEGRKLDWSLGMTMDLPIGALGVSYVDTDLHDPIGSAAGVVSLTRSF